jgi:hypothetical protein
MFEVQIGTYVDPKILVCCVGVDNGEVVREIVFSEL